MIYASARHDPGWSSCRTRSSRANALLAISADAFGFRQPERARVNSRVRKQRLLRLLAEGHAWRTSLAKLTANSLARVSPPLDKDEADGPAFSTDVTYEPHKLDCLSVP